MGLFDTVVVRRELLDPLLQDEPEILADMQSRSTNDYYDFQTKDLDNALFTFYLENDKKFRVQRYLWKEEEYDCTEISFYDITTYVSFYDYLGTVGDNDVFITFKAHIVRGECQSLEIESIEKTPIKSIQTRHQELKHQEAFLNGLFCYRVSRRLRWVLYDLEHWLRKHFFTPGHNLAKKLQDKAEDEFQRYQQWNLK